MKKRRLVGWILLALLLGAGAVLIPGFIVGCGATTIKVAGATRDEAGRALWEAGAKRTEHGLFGSEEVQIWPDPEKIHWADDVIEYKLDHFLHTTHGKDHVSLEKGRHGGLTVSLRCEEKTSGFLSLDLFYDRNREREKRLVQEAAWHLLKDGATVESSGDWHPARNPIVCSAHGAKWIAYRGAPPRIAVDYLLSEDYQRVSQSSEKVLFTRELQADPEGGDMFPLFSDKVDWKSREKVMVKSVRPAAGETNTIVVIGIAAEGHKHVEEFSLLGPNRVHDEAVGGLLASGTLKNVALAAATKRKRLEFVSPAPWTEPVGLPAWRKPTRTDRHLEEERESARFVSVTSDKSRFWQGVLRRHGKRVIVTKYYRYTDEKRRAGKGIYTYVPEFVAEQEFEGPWRIHFNPAILHDDELEAKVVDLK